VKKVTNTVVELISPSRHHSLAKCNSKQDYHSRPIIIKDVVEENGESSIFSSYIVCVSDLEKSAHNFDFSDLVIAKVKNVPNQRLGE
jgi:hypothetical protein